MEKSHEACEGFGDRSHGGGSDRGKLSYGWGYSMISEAIKLEREKRKTKREDALMDILKNDRIMLPIMGIAGCVILQKLGESRAINRDWAGFLLATWTGLLAAQSGITDRYALAAISAATAAAYAVTTPATEEEAVVVLSLSNFSKALGGDGKLFWWDMPFAGPND